VNAATRREFGLRTSLALGVPALLLIAMFSARTLEQLVDPGRVLEMQIASAGNRNMLFGYLAGAAMFNFSFMGLVTMRLVRRLSEQARLDPLTGLLNRRAFEELFDGEWGRLRRGGPGFAVLALDLDHFKRINDAHGHLAGDAVLAQTAQRLRQAARQIDTVARTGGEEFIVLVPHADRNGALAVAERLRLAVRQEPFSTPRGNVPVTLSIGVAVARPDETDTRAVLQRADRALYDAKAAGRDISCVASD
jgi:diguanylate cyclase (GGDEF)-like protein